MKRDPVIKETPQENIRRLENDLLAWASVTCNGPIRLLSVMGATASRLIYTLDPSGKILESYIATLRSGVEILARERSNDR